MTGSDAVVNIRERFTRFDDVWSPKIVAEANGWHVKVVKARGLFTWHSHDVDEIFVVVSGSLVIGLRTSADVRLGPGELFVVHRHTEHRPDAGNGCEMMLLEPPGVINTGDAGGSLTAVDEWL